MSARSANGSKCRINSPADSKRFSGFLLIILRTINSIFSGTSGEISRNDLGCDLR